MTRLPIKRVLAGAIAATMFALQLPLPALAATDGAVLAAAQSGINYLAANENADGSISGFGGESDWSVEAIQADGQQASTFSHGGSGSLLDFLKIDVPSAATSTTALERKIIALAAAGQDATNFGGVNYETLLESQHIGGQIGDPTLLNDDAFGVIAIDAVHATQLQSEAQDGLNYLLAHQGADGGFSYTTASCAFCGSDSSDTASAIIAMQAATSMGLSNPGLAAAKTSALAYLLSTQQPDGGFAADIFSPSDGDSTAWDLMALNDLGSPVQTQASAARDWLLDNQNADGGFGYVAYGTTTSDTYTTAHAIIALLGTTWLLQPAPLRGSVASSGLTPTGGSGSGTVVATAISPVATPTDSTAITTTSSSDTPPAADAGEPQVLGAQTTDPGTTDSAVPAKTEAKQSAADSNKPKIGYSLYAVLALGFIAFIWYMIQSRRKPEGV